MNSDLSFTDAKSVPGDVVHACRSGVLYNLLGVKNAEGSLRDHYLEVVRILRARISLLAGNGWNGLKPDDFRTLSFLRNCLPFGLRLPEQHRPTYCNRYRICPWCHARKRMMPVIRSIDTAVRALTAVCQPAEIKLSLASLVSQWHYDDSIPLKSVLMDEQGLLRSDWENNEKNKGVFGCVVRSLVVPRRISASGEKPAVYDGHILRVTTIILHDTTFQPLNMCDADFRNTEKTTDVSKLSIAKLVAKQLLFSAAVLYSPIDRIVPVLNAYTKTRHTTFSSGLLSNNELCRAAEYLKKKHHVVDTEADLPVEEEMT